MTNSAGNANLQITKDFCGEDMKAGSTFLDIEKRIVVTFTDGTTSVCVLFKKNDISDREV